MSFGARAHIKLGALRHNLQIIRERSPGSKVMAVVKANAYGHGMVEAAKTLADADSLAVARLSEAKTLRAAGIESPIVILEGVFDSDELGVAVSSDCEIVVHCIEQLELLESLGARRITVWLKFETGMNRLGLPASDAAQLIERARQCESIAELRLMSHLANADDRQDEKSTEQVRLFESIAEGFDGDISIASSPGIFGWPKLALTGAWVRPGIARPDLSTARASMNISEIPVRSTRPISSGSTSEPCPSTCCWATVVTDGRRSSRADITNWPRWSLLNRVLVSFGPCSAKASRCRLCGIRPWKT